MFLSVTREGMNKSANEFKDKPNRYIIYDWRVKYNKCHIFRRM